MTDIVERLRKRIGFAKLDSNFGAAEDLSEAADEIERLREVIRQRTFLLDKYMGTPCEQIRHEGIDPPLRL
jgi:hypothetical protein